MILLIKRKTLTPNQFVLLQEFREQEKTLVGLNIVNERKKLATDENAVFSIW